MKVDGFCVTCFMSICVTCFMSMPFRQKNQHNRCFQITKACCLTDFYAPFAISVNALSENV